jgi:hypothetical protein
MIEHLLLVEEVGHGGGEGEHDHQHKQGHNDHLTAISQKVTTFLINLTPRASLELHKVLLQNCLKLA